MAADSNQPEFTKVSQKRGPGPGRFDDLESQTSMLTLIMTMLAAFNEDEEVEKEKPENGFAAILGFETQDEFHDWHQSVRDQKLNAQGAARTLDTHKINFTAAGKVSIPQAMHVAGNSILDVIASHESGGDYNIAFGGKKADFTSMTIDQVLKWQEDRVAGGAASSAVGRYQFLNKTLDELKDKLKLSGDEIFDEKMQDRLAMCLLDRRGYSDFVSGRKTEGEFMLSLSKEWASLPRDMGGLSYYHGDGLNKAHTKAEDVLTALQEIKENGASIAARNAAQVAAASGGPSFKNIV